MELENGQAYKLKAFAMHHGRNMNSGHYVAVAKTRSNCWFKFNDSEVSKIVDDQSFEQFYSSVYMLAYERSSESRSTARFIHESVMLEKFVVHTRAFLID